MLAQSLAALDASSGNPTNDASLPQVGSASLEVVAFVGVQFQWSSTGGVLAGQQSQELRPRTSRTSWSRAQDHQRNASSIYDDVPLGAELASVRWVRACFLAPRGLGTEEPSMLARLQSIWSCSRKRDSMAWCNCSQTPARHAAAVPKRLGKVFPGNAGLQNEQDAVEGSFVADRKLARTAFGRRHEG